MLITRLSCSTRRYARGVKGPWMISTHRYARGAKDPWIKIKALVPEESLAALADVLEVRAAEPAHTGGNSLTGDGDSDCCGGRSF